MLSRSDYEHLIYTLPTRFPSIRFSTLVLAPPGLDIARLTGLVALGDDIVLCVYELLDFQQGIIEAYRYEVSECHPPFGVNPLPEPEEYCSVSYVDKRTLYWYDSWPHPNAPSLAATHPHHKHVLPDIKRNRVPAVELSFSRPNLPCLIREVERDLLGQA
ncbi:MAG: DUF6516 family protein [Anaerolineae bacterium]|jgi:hypothetical protein